MSTHDWWLQLTMPGAILELSSLATSHFVRWVRRIHPLLPATQRMGRSAREPASPGWRATSASRKIGSTRKAC